MATGVSNVIQHQSSLVLLCSSFSFPSRVWLPHPSTFSATVHFVWRHRSYWLCGNGWQAWVTMSILSCLPHLWGSHPSPPFRCSSSDALVEGRHLSHYCRAFLARSFEMISFHKQKVEIASLEPDILEGLEDHFEWQPCLMSLPAPMTLLSYFHMWRADLAGAAGALTLEGLLLLAAACATSACDLIGPLSSCIYLCSCTPLPPAHGFG